MRWLIVAAPFVVLVLAAIDWGLFFAHPTPWNLAMAVITTGCFFITLVPNINA